MYYSWLADLGKDMIHLLSQSWLDDKRKGFDAHGCHWIWHSLNNLCVAQQLKTMTLQRRSQRCLFFPARFGYLCSVKPSVCSVPQERLFPSMRDTRKSSLREAAGHWSATAQPEIQSQITSPKPNTQTRTNCVWILSRVNIIVLPNSREIEDVCSQASTQEAYPLPALCPGKRPDYSVYKRICVCSFVHVCLCGTQDSKRRIADPPDPLCLRPNNTMSKEKPQVQRRTSSTQLTSPRPPFSDPAVH